MDRPVSQLSDGSALQPRVTAQFYLENKGKYILEGRGPEDPKEGREERETPGPLAPRFMIFLLPWACPV